MELDEVLDGGGPALPPTVRAKRPRIIAPADAFGVPIAPKRLKRPADHLLPKSALTSNDKRICAFCCLPGNVRECEGKLMGPFRSLKRDGRTSSMFYAHRNCALWAPETFVAAGSRLQQVDLALSRSRRKKCCLCGDLGASLSCMFKNTACCRPMHFRCALVGGASLRVGYNTFCPKHANSTRNLTAPSSPIEDHFIDRTPVPEQFLRPGSGCLLCSGDTYHSDNGVILTCSICYAREHSKCLFPNLERDFTFAARSWQGKHYCKSCMRCVECEEAVDREVYNIKEPIYQAQEEEDLQCNTVKCASCKHSAIHVACLPAGATPEYWRCDMCLVCRHCSVINVPRHQWTERYEACLECATEIRKGGVICPVCVKVYREGENLPMVQCDYCDRWIHADVCGGISEKRFSEMGMSDSKYRCPLCTQEKKKRDLGRRRSSDIANADKADGSKHTKLTEREDLEDIIKQLPPEDDGKTFFLVRKAATQGKSFVNVLTDLAVGIDICKHCCSSGKSKEMLFCSDCGECYHEFCHNAKITSPIPGWTKQDCKVEGEGLNRYSKQKGLGRERSTWRCVQCTSYSNMTPETKWQGENHKKVLTSHACNGRPEILGNDNSFSFDPRNNLKASHVGLHRETWQNGRHHTESIDISRKEAYPSQPPKTSVIWQDDRRCELCSKSEGLSDAEGRLIPWNNSTVADISSSWVHIACALWSSGISIHGSDEHVDTLVGPRRYILGRARRRTCVLCQKSGASLCCSVPSCDNVYHFSCAREVAVACLVSSATEKFHRTLRFAAVLDRAERKSFDLASIRSLRILCPSHKQPDPPVKEWMPLMIDVQKLLNLSTVVRILDSQDFTPDSEPPRRKRLSPDRLLSLRIGSLAVLRFGRLIPEVNDFLVKGSLIPLGYCASRRYWSLARPFRRCVYFMEVCGHPQSGPIFIIRCADIPSWKSENQDPDKAWSAVVEGVKHARLLSGSDSLIQVASRTTGLEAFGLSNCIPVVSHIESLPMAAMFRGRYTHKRVVTHRDNDIIFYNTLALKYKPVSTRQNETGCARTEGYLPTSHRKKRASAVSERKAIGYENARTGSAFQLQVAREIFARYEGSYSRMLQKDKNTKIRTMSTPFAQSLNWARNAKTKAAPTQAMVTEHMGIAASSKTRTVVLRSNIDGLGVFATKDIPAGEMIIEYVGEMIRPPVSDLREKQYCAKGIGCYMFQIVPGEIIDATMCGNAARYINHSCTPNCYSKTVKLENNRHVVVIFAKRRVQRGEELSYDYQFPLDDSDRVKCGCGAAQCKGFMN